ncbi:MAG TPA: AI-2E family transporter, partial [Methylobacterium sp.]|nr:AI-2E family transporter [Methylobacterium sp.]
MDRTLRAANDPGPTDGVTRARSQGAARVALVLALSLLGLWILHGFLPALVWAVILAIALGPLYARAERRWP